jgi:DNA-binding response OmpR family regulator
MVAVLPRHKKAMPILRFGVFEVDSASGELRKRGSRLRLSEQPRRLLLALVDQAGQVLTREQLRQRLWPDGTFVDFDRAINKAVSELRGVLGDSAATPRFIETHSNAVIDLSRPSSTARMRHWPNRPKESIPTRS